MTSEITPISPWTEQTELQSPDGQYIAYFQNGAEIAMGAPTIGELRIKTSSGGDYLVADNAAASFVWSDDSEFLAFSKWRFDRNQSLCVLQLSSRNVDESPDEFRVLELRSFSKGIVHGVDSPIHMPQTFSLQYTTADNDSGPS